MDFDKIIYWVSTGLLTAVFLFSAYNYFFNYEMIAGFYENLGFPTWIIYPSAIAKILGLIAIHSKLSTWLTEWAYAGFFFDAVLAYSAHYYAEDGQGMFAIIAIFSTLFSRFYWKRLYG